MQADGRTAETLHMFHAGNAKHPELSSSYSTQQQQHTSGAQLLRPRGGREGGNGAAMFAHDPAFVCV